MRYEDIHISDVSIRQNFINFINAGNFASALKLLEDNPQVTDKSTMAIVFNELRERVFGLENVYYTEVEDYMANLLVQMQDTVNDLNDMGEFDATVEYKERNLVHYDNNYYYCLQNPPVGTLPTNETFWLYLGLRGVRGRDGISNVTFKGQYSDTEQYNANDIVYLGLNFYYAKIPNSGQPVTNTEYWGLFLETNAIKILVQAETPGPTDMGANDFWFQILN